MGDVSEVKAGWYPDYADVDGQLRYWDGQRWTDQRMPVGATGEHAARELDRGPSLTWVYVAAAAVVAVLVVALGVTALRGDDEKPGSDEPPTAESSAADPSQEPSAPVQSLEVVSAIDSVTLELADGASVRLRGLEPPASGACAGQAADVLASLVVDGEVILVQKGPDLDAEGNLLRYVERDGLDIGLRMIQRGLVTASDEAHPRAAQYHRVDDRTPAACT
jgi:hypothetical protein